MNVHCDPLMLAAAAANLDESPTEMVVAEMADAVADSVQCDADVAEGSRNVEDIAMVTESLESYVASFMERVPADAWNSKYARQYQLGVGNLLNAAQIPLPTGLFCSSFESIGVSQTSLENRQETEGKSKGLIARMWAAFKAACAKLAELLTNLVTTYGKSESACWKMLRNLEFRVTTMGGTKKKDSFSGSPQWAAYLQSSHKTLTPSESLTTTIKFGKELAGEWVGSYVKLGTSIISKLKAGQEVSEAELPQGTPNGVNEIYDFPGLTRIIVSGGVDDDINVLNSVIKVSRTPDVKITEGPAVLGYGEIQDIIKGIAKIAGFMNDTSRELKNAIRELKTMSSGINKDRVKQGPAIISKIMARIGAGPRTILPVVGGIAQNAYMHANASLKQYE